MGPNFVASVYLGSYGTRSDRGDMNSRKGLQECARVMLPPHVPKSELGSQPGSCSSQPYKRASTHALNHRELAAADAPLVQRAARGTVSSNLAAQLQDSLHCGGAAGQREPAEEQSPRSAPGASSRRAPLISSSMTPRNVPRRPAAARSLSSRARPSSSTRSSASASPAVRAASPRARRRRALSLVAVRLQAIAVGASCGHPTSSCGR